MLLVPGEEVVGHHRYAIDHLVGSGAYAAVYAARDEIGRDVALKEFFPAPHPREAHVFRQLFERERFVLSQVSAHPLVPTFYEGFVWNDQYYLAQEFVEGQTLEDIISRNPHLGRDWMLKWAVSLCDVLTYIHDRQIVHHDLKPANIRITPDGQLRLLDYGGAQYFGTDDTTVAAGVFADAEMYGTEGYLPPEVEETFVADVRTDIFALGCILYEMVVGEPPEQQRISERNLYVTTPLMQRKDVNLEYVRLVTTALSYNTEYRFASARIFLNELKKIAPPVLLVSHKSLYFGTVAPQSDVTKKFRLYNGGGGAELEGEVRSLTPWLHIDVPRFRTRRRDVFVVAKPDMVKTRNHVEHGQVEVVTNDQRGPDGKVKVKGDRWVVDCYIAVAPTPAKIVLKGTKDEDGILRIATCRAGHAKITALLENVGESSALLRFDDASGSIAFDPTSIKIEGGKVGEVAMEITTSGLEQGTTKDMEVCVRSNNDVILKVPVKLHIRTTLEEIRSKLIGH
jgi:tRNA A-37 threonylcarbamoyl transferase component Bud32